MPTRLAYTKNLINMFGVHIAWVYGSSAAAKTSALNATTKDLTREAYARDYMQRPILPKILKEVPQEYLTLLDSMEEEPTPITLPCLPALGLAPSTST